jgi:hypothetical protein
VITLHRDRQKHKINGKLQHRIPQGLRGAHLRKKNRQILELKRSKGTLASGDFKAQYWKPAKEALKAESHEKCAYCELAASANAYGDVEHYRPKKRYWWLAYCYDNYLYACQLCNQAYKGDNFPTQGPPLAEPVINPHTPDAELDALAARLCPDPIKTDEGCPLADHLQDCLAERPLLLNPYTDEPEKHIAWKAIPALREVRMVAVEGSTFSDEAVQAMEKYYGLNRERLCRLRWEWYDILTEFRDDLLDPSLSPARREEKKQKLKALIGPDRQFSGMARYFVQKVWKLALE